MYELGDHDGFRLTGHTKLSVLVNHEEVSINGNNIGMGTDIVPGSFETGAELQSVFESTLANPNPNTFSDSDSVTHLSPMIEQSLVAEIPIFGLLPILNDCPILEGARLRAGYTIIAADQIVSPNQSIVWQGRPVDGLFPEVDIQRRSWWTMNWSLGVETRY